MKRSRKNVFQRIFIIGIGFSSFLLPATVFAHCPLCTAGAGLITLGAYWLGVNGLTIGVFLGAFAVAMGLWIARIIKKKYLIYQDAILGVFSWITTILPLKMLLSDYTSIYINWRGPYGSLLNRTYPINLFLVGSFTGGILIFLTPRLSRFITEYRGITLPYQGVLLTLALLGIISIITQFIL